MRDVVTTVVELVGLIAVVVGVFVVWGFGWALVVGGAAAVGVSFMVSRGTR